MQKSVATTAGFFVLKKQRVRWEQNNLTKLIYELEIGMYKINRFLFYEKDVIISNRKSMPKNRKEDSYEVFI